MVGKSQIIFFAVCRTLGKSPNLFLAFAEPPASLKFIFCRLPNPRQVSKSFFVVCRTVGKSQNLFLAFAELPASPKIFFYRLPSFGQVPILFFEVCPMGNRDFLFVMHKWDEYAGIPACAVTSKYHSFRVPNAKIRIWITASQFHLRAGWPNITAKIC